MCSKNMGLAAVTRATSHNRACTVVHERFAVQTCLVLHEEVLESVLEVVGDGEVAPAGRCVGGVDVERPVPADHQPRRVAAVHRRQVRLQEPAVPQLHSMRDPKADSELSISLTAASRKHAEDWRSRPLMVTDHSGGA